MDDDYSDYMVVTFTNQNNELVITNKVHLNQQRVTYLLDL